MITLTKATPDAVKYACITFHYAQVVPSYMYAYNVYNCDKEWCGVILYGNGAMGINSPFGLLNGEVLELVRVALNGKQPYTSQCVAASLRQLHKDAPQAKIIVSYADIDQGHAGIIYQATNWIYLGRVQVGGYQAILFMVRNSTQKQYIHMAGNQTYSGLGGILTPMLKS